MAIRVPEEAGNFLSGFHERLCSMELYCEDDLTSCMLQSRPIIWTVDSQDISQCYRTRRFIAVFTKSSHFPLP